VTSVVTDVVPNKPLSLLAIGVGTANEFVNEHHRHNKEVKIGSRFAIAAIDDSGTIWGVAIVSHPVNRMLNYGGYTAEVRRVCTKRDAPKELLLHAVQRVLASLESDGRHQGDHLHLGG
jgi:hypothetical protein